MRDQLLVNTLIFLLEEYEDLTDDNNYFTVEWDEPARKLRDGVVLAYLIHHLWPGNINLKKIVRGVKVNDNASNAPYPRIQMQPCKSRFHHNFQLELRT